MGLYDFQALVPYTTTKSFMRALLNPNPTRRLTAEQALSYPWLVSIAAPTEHNLCGLCENFDARTLAQHDQGGAGHVALFCEW